MALSYNEVTAEAGQTVFTVTFPFLERDHVKVSSDKVDLADDAWEWISDSSVEVLDPMVGGEQVRVYRTTPTDAVTLEFAPGAFDYQLLNTGLTFLRYIVEEAYDNGSTAIEAGNDALSYLLQIEEIQAEVEAAYADIQTIGASASASASTATTKASEALTSASNALASATAASGSASTATTKASEASASATAASGSASTATTKASEASTSASNAATSAATATTKAGEASASATAAAGSASAAATSASNAATSEANAAASAASIDPATLVKNTAQSLSETQKGQARANIGAGVLAGFRNKIINGDFDVNQRGSVTGNTFARWFGPDRWNMNAGGTGTPSLSMSQQPNADSSIPGSPEFMGRFASNTTGTFSAVLLEHRIENVRTLSGKKATLTFYAKSSPAYASGFTVSVYQNFGSGGSATVTALASQGIALTGSFQKFQFVIDIPSVAGKTIGAGNYLQLVINFPLSAVTLDLSRVSLVEGDASAEADPFAPRHPQQERALCNRYYFKPDTTAVVPFLNGNSAGAADYTGCMFPLPAQMRTAPTVSATWASLVNTSSQSVDATNNFVRVAIRAAAPGNFFANLTALSFDAEL